MGRYKYALITLLLVGMLGVTSASAAAVPQADSTPEQQAQNSGNKLMSLLTTIAFSVGGITIVAGAILSAGVLGGSSAAKGYRVMLIGFGILVISASVGYLQDLATWLAPG
jgi:hypothetical protein